MPEALARVSFRRPVLHVCMVSTFVSGLAGLLCVRFYGTPLLLGVLWGGFCGLLAALFWSRIMLRRIGRQTPDVAFRSGPRLGILFGVLMTCLLHFGLGSVSHLHTGDVVVLLCFAVPLFGLPLGWAVGRGCTRYWRATLNRAETETVTHGDTEGSTR